MIYFLKQLSKNWIALLGFIPAFYDLVSAYLPWDFEFPKLIIYSFAILAFLYAAYQTFDEEHKKRKALEKKLEGPTNYKITAILIPIDFEEKKLLEKIDEIKNEAIKHLESIQPIKEAHKSAEIEHIKISIENLIPQSLPFTKTTSQYNNEVQAYKNKLQEIIDNINNYKDRLSATIASWENKYFFIKFLIENTGITSDSDIQIEIICNYENLVFEKKDFTKYGLDIFSLLPSLPKKPEKPKIKDPMEALRPNYIDRIHSLPNIPNIPNPNAFRKEIEINEQKCSVTIRDLHVGDQANLFTKQLIIKKDAEEIGFKATIRSKESTRVLNPTVSIEYKKPSKVFFEPNNT